MARVARQTLYTAATIVTLLERWKRGSYPSMNLTGGKSLLDYAAPDSEADFTPNAPAMYGLLDCLKGSIRQHFSGTKASYNSFMSMYSRWKRDDANFREWDAHLNNAKQEGLLTKASEEYTEARDARYRPVTGWVNYETWLHMLGKAGVLDELVISAIPRHYQRTRTNLHRMLSEWKACGGMVTAPVQTGRDAAPKVQMLPIVGDALVQGAVAMTEAMFDAVGAVPEVSGAALDGMADTSGMFMGYMVRGDVHASMAGRWFINCVFTDVVFRGCMDGAVFIKCDFEGACRIAAGVSAGNMLFKACRTIDGRLVMQNLSMSGLRMYQCGEMQVDVKRSGLGNSHIVDGWVDCGRGYGKVAGRAAEGERVAPRTVTGSTWENGGLVFDVQNVPAQELNDNVILSIVEAVLSHNVRMTMVKHPHTGTVARCGDAAEVLVVDECLSTWELSQYAWATVTADEVREATEFEARRTEARGTARVEYAQPEAPMAPERNALEDIVLRELDE